MAGLTDSQLVDTFKQSASSLSGHQIASFLIASGFYRNKGQIQAQLVHAGFNQKQATAALSASGPSTFQKFLQAGAGLLFVPGSVAEEILGGTGGAAAGAESGAAAGAGSTAANAANAASTAAKALAGVSVLGFLSSGQNWIRLLEVIAGLILIVMGLHQLTGAGSGVATVAKAAGKAAVL